MAAHLRKAKVVAKKRKKRRDHDKTDQNGTILDLQEHLAATAEEEAKDEPLPLEKVADVLDGWGSDDDDAPPMSYSYDEVPDSWED